MPGRGRRTLALEAATGGEPRRGRAAAAVAAASDWPAVTVAAQSEPESDPEPESSQAARPARAHWQASLADLDSRRGCDPGPAP